MQPQVTITPGPDSGTISWVDGDATPKNIEFLLTDDALSEGTEFFDIALSNPQGTSLGATTNLQIQVVDAGGANSAPNSIAGGSQTVSAGATVTLNGNGSNDPDGDNLSYAWTQTQGQSVNLSNADSAQASFVAPTVSSDTLLRFELEVTDAGGASDTSTTNVTVTAAPGTGSGGGGGGGSTGLALILALVGLALNRRTGASSRLSVHDRDRSR